MIIVIIILLFLVYNSIENFATSPGTMIQLAAKGPQDIALTGFPEDGVYLYAYRPIRSERSELNPRIRRRMFGIF